MKQIVIGGAGLAVGVLVALWLSQPEGASPPLVAGGPPARTEASALADREPLLDLHASIVQRVLFEDEAEAIQECRAAWKTSHPELSEKLLATFTFRDWMGDQAELLGVEIMDAETMAYFEDACFMEVFGAKRWVMAALDGEMTISIPLNPHLAAQKKRDPVKNPFLPAPQ